MIDLQKYLTKKIQDVILSWDEEEIYAISFFVYSNESFEYNGISNVTEFYVSYNTESDCKGVGPLSEKRWNYAFWRKNEAPIIQARKDDEGMRILFDWYREQELENIGYEDTNLCYDSGMNYVGTGPIGYYELLNEITAVAKKMQENGFIKNKFKKAVPIIIHDLEYSWYVMKATKIANPNGEAEMFFEAMREVF